MKNVIFHTQDLCFRTNLKCAKKQRKNGGFMIIDFHTHTFPDELADRAVGTLAHSGGIHNYLDGRVDSLKESMKKLELITPYCFPWQPSLISATQSIHLL